MKESKVKNWLSVLRTALNKHINDPSKLRTSVQVEGELNYLLNQRASHEKRAEY